MDDITSSCKVAQAIAAMERTIKERIASGKITVEAVEKMRLSLDLDLADYCRFQDLKSQAHAMQKLSGNDAQHIYGLLGNTPDAFNKRSAATKYILWNLLGELAAWKIAGGKAGHEAP